MLDPPTSGGNLVVADGYLLIATPRKLVAFGPGPPNRRSPTDGAGSAVSSRVAANREMRSPTTKSSIPAVSAPANSNSDNPVRSTDSR